MVARDVGNTENFVSIDLDCGAEGSVTLISGYFKYRVPTAFHVAALDGLYQTAASEVIIALDANAFSTRWFSRITDNREEVLNTWLDAHDLRTVNRRSPHTTFNGPRGRTNIDITVGGERILGKLRDWEVDPGVTSSDHQLITFMLDLQLRTCATDCLL